MHVKKLATFTFLLLGCCGQTWLSHAQTRKPLAYTTPAKTVPVSLRQAGKTDYEIRGQAALTVTAAKVDDTLTGTFVYALPTEARQELATRTNQPLNQIPAIVTKKAVKAAFQKGSACPWLRLELNPERLEINGIQLYIQPVVLDMPETRDYLSQLFCHWARQINVNRQRRGIIAAINRALNGEEE